MKKEKYTRVNPRNINKERIYMLMDKADMLAAMKVMSNNAFKVFMYLMSNQDGWSSNHARKAVSDNTGIDKANVSRCFTELKELGYIVEVDGTEIVYSYSTTEGRPAAYTEPHVAGVNNWTEADKEKYGKKTVKASCSTDHTNTTVDANATEENDKASCQNNNYDFPEEDCSCQNNNYEEGLVVETTSTSCQNNITNITYNTSTNTTVDADANASEESDKIIVETTTTSCQNNITNTTNNTSTNTVETVEENNNVVVETTTTSSIDDAASEDAEASSGMSEQELRDYFKSQGDIRKVFVKDTLKPWLKYGDGYTSNLTCLELWWKVKDNYEDLGKGSLKCDHQSLAATYTLWKRAIVAKEKD